MSFADFESTIFDSNGGNLTWANSDVAGGVAIAHSSLSSPLSGEGSFLRSLSPSLTGNADGNQIIDIAPGALSGAFDSVPSSKAVSLRAWVRADGLAQSNEGFSAGIVAKALPNDGTNAGDAFAGYKLKIGTMAVPGSGPSSFELRLQAARGDGTDGTAATVVCSGSYAFGAWYKLRLDVIPQGNGADLLVAFTGAGATGSEVWTEVGRLTVLSTDSNFLPWAQSASRFGFYSSIYSISGRTKTYSGYFDRFLASVVSL